MAGRGGSTRRLAAAIFLLLTGIYGLTAGGHTYSTDEEGMLQTTRSLVERRSPVLDIDEANVRVTPSTPGRDGEPVGVSGLGQSVAGIPLYLVGAAVSHAVAPPYRDFTERLFLGWTSSVATAAGAVLVLLVAGLLGAPRRWAVVLALSYGLATMVWAHSKTFFNEPLTTALALAATYCALNAVQSGRFRWAAGSGAFAGLAVAVRPTAALFLPILGLYLLLAFPRMRAGWLNGAVRVGLGFAGGAAPALALFFASNGWRYGSWTRLGPKNVFLTNPLLDGLYGFFLSPGKSLFLYAPIVLAGLVAVPFAPRGKRPALALLLALGAVNVAFYARYYQWHGDHAWGPRYLIMTIPFFALPLAAVLDRIRWQRALVAATVAGLATSGLGVVMYFNSYFYIAQHSLGSVDTPVGPSYWEPMHYDPYWSPIAGTVRALPDVLRNSARRLDGQDPGLEPFPAGEHMRYAWYYPTPQLDSWAYWVLVSRAPRKLLLMVPFFVGLAVIGATLLRRALREGGVTTPDGFDATPVGTMPAGERAFAQY